MKVSFESFCLKCPPWYVSHFTIPMPVDWAYSTSRNSLFHARKADATAHTTLFLKYSNGITKFLMVSRRLPMYISTYFA